MTEIFTVFYSWQSDRPRSHGRDLVREALERAAAAVSNDNAIPYRIQIISDTEGEAGLCNIPETILRRLRESDAVVTDLTFVAKTEDDKQCSNPNVLFELGYAFASIGHERLICVLNEAHGSNAEQIFDLAHHRRPIAYQSPDDACSRAQTVAKLAINLEAALRGVVALGLVGDVESDDNVHFLRQASDVDAVMRSTMSRNVNVPVLTFQFHPKRYRERRFPDIPAIESLLTKASPRTQEFREYPPRRTGTSNMNWGLYNEAYGNPWAFTYAGLFVGRVFLHTHGELRLSARDTMLARLPPEQTTLPAESWISAPPMLSELAVLMQLASNVSEVFAQSEFIVLDIEINYISGRWLRFKHDAYGICKSPHFTRHFELPIAEFACNSRDIFCTVGVEFANLFIQDGRTISKEALVCYAVPSSNA